jgi:hypothetical protein
MKCQRCGREVSDDDNYEYLGQTLCDDCYMDARQPVKTCDPWAVYLAGRTRDNSGMSGTEGLTELQKDIYEFIRDKGEVKPEELIRHFNLSESELHSEFAVLRHCELVKGDKQADGVYIVPFG